MSEEIKNEELEAMAEEEYDEVIVVTNDAGDEMYFVQECIFPVGDKTFALLVDVTEEDECEEGCDCHEHHHDEECDCEDNVVLARVVFDEDGNPEYIAPTEEEFEEAKAAYEALEFEDEE